MGRKIYKNVLPLFCLILPLFSCQSKGLNNNTGSGYSQNNRDFGTPQAVMEYFVNNVKNGNFDNVFLTSPYSDDSLIKKINPREVIKYMGSNIFQLDGNMPSQYQAITKYTLLGKYSAGLKRFIVNLLLSEEYPEYAINLTPFQVDDSILDNYFSLLDIKNLKLLELVRIDIWRPDLQFGQRGKENAIRQYVKTFGCDEKIDYTALYKINGRYYDGGVTIVRYGTNWYIESLHSLYLGIALGALEQVSGVAEYLSKYEIQ
jgi:hypothetical protein